MSAQPIEHWQAWVPEAKLALFAKLRKDRWHAQARPTQIEPDGSHSTWYLMGGRGSGKTRTGAETLADWILENDPGEWAIIAPTFGAGRDVCMESEGGLIAALGPAVSNWNRSIGELYIGNGSKVYVDGADDGALRIQGRNLRGAWCDEIGLWAVRQWARAWDESLAFALRLAPGKIVATGTPKAGHPLVKKLASSPRVAVSRMRMIDNIANLSPSRVEELMERYSGTRLGRQELDAELIDDVEGALWTRLQIEDLRVDSHPDLKRIVVAVDPNASSSEAANSGGIIVAGLGTNNHGYVLADRTTTSGGPRAWAKAAVEAYEEFGADRIVAEKNNGGEMVKLTILTVNQTVPVKLVSASQGKRTRAEPVASLYEGDEAFPARVHHLRSAGLLDLEEEMVTWTPEAESPDRMDALVWGLTELMLHRMSTGSTVTLPTGRIPVVDRTRGNYGVRGY